MKNFFVAMGALVLLFFAVPLMSVAQEGDEVSFKNENFSAASRLIGEYNAVGHIYQSQIDNIRLPDSTCGITSVAMALRFFGNNVTSNQLLERYDYTIAQSNQTMAKIFDDYRLRYDIFYTASRAQLQSHLRAGHPVILQTYFTRSGHIIALVGYDDTGWIVHDPNGEWSGSPGSSPYKSGSGLYNKVNGRGGPYFGKFVHYTYSDVEASEGINNYQGIAIRRP